MTADGSDIKFEIEDVQAALQAEVQQRLETEDRLRRMKEEFDDFILTAAHDLREPVRTITAYSELLLRKSEAVDVESEQFRRHILDATGRIQALIAGMGACVEAGSESRYMLSIDMNDVVREAKAHIRPQTVLTCDALPVLHGDSDKLGKVFRHLFDNAEKYNDKPECRIHIAARREGPDWLFAVTDNGPGIEPQYRERVFQPFKRLHGRQYPGSGLGLAFCRKAIESHGGRIWVESKPDEGSIFCFTLPAGR